MNIEINKKLLTVAIASATLLSACGGSSSDEDSAVTNPAASAPSTLTRIATIPLGAELTGITKTDNGELFFNLQHPSQTLPLDESKAAIGAWIGVDFNNLPSTMPYLFQTQPLRRQRPRKLHLAAIKFLGAKVMTVPAASPSA
jgi:secreted PhoX family phosphatase